MAPWPVRLACDRRSRATLVGHRMGNQNFYHPKLLRASKGTLSRLQSLAPTNPY
jgi:hypothetical protein